MSTHVLHHHCLVVSWLQNITRRPKQLVLVLENCTQRGQQLKVVLARTHNLDVVVFLQKDFDTGFGVVDSLWNGVEQFVKCYSSLVFSFPPHSPPPLSPLPPR